MAEGPGLAGMQCDACDHFRGFGSPHIVPDIDDNTFLVLAGDGNEIVDRFTEGISFGIKGGIVQFLFNDDDFALLRRLFNRCVYIVGIGGGRHGVCGQCIVGICLILHLQLYNIQRTYHMCEWNTPGFPGFQAGDTDQHRGCIAGDVIIDPDIVEILTCIVGYCDQIVNFVAQTEGSLASGRRVGHRLREKELLFRLLGQRFAVFNRIHIEHGARGTSGRSGKEKTGIAFFHILFRNRIRKGIWPGFPGVDDVERFVDQGGRINKGAHGCPADIQLETYQIFFPDVLNDQRDIQLFPGFRGLNGYGEVRAYADAACAFLQIDSEGNTVGDARHNQGIAVAAGIQPCEGKREGFCFTTAVQTFGGKPGNEHLLADAGFRETLNSFTGTVHHSLA